MKNKNPKRPLTLRDQVQQVTDTTDAKSYEQVLPFLTKTFSELKLEKIDLSTQENAHQALDVLKIQLEKLQQATNRTRALKNFLETQREIEE